MPRIILLGVRPSFEITTNGGWRDRRGSVADAREEGGERSATMSRSLTPRRPVVVRRGNGLESRALQPSALRNAQSWERGDGADRGGVR